MTDSVQSPASQATDSTKQDWVAPIVMDYSAVIITQGSGNRSGDGVSNLS